MIWVQTDVEIAKQRMFKRDSDRDRWKLDHWDEYIAGVNFGILKDLDNPALDDDFLIFKNNSDEEFNTSMKAILDIIEA